MNVSDAVGASGCWPSHAWRSAEPSQDSEQRVCSSGQTHWQRQTRECCRNMVELSRQVASKGIKWPVRGSSEAGYLSSPSPRPLASSKINLALHIQPVRVCEVRWEIKQFVSIHCSFFWRGWRWQRIGVNKSTLGLLNCTVKPIVSSSPIL